VAADHNALVGLVAVAIVSQDMGGGHLDGVLHGGQVLVGWSNSLLDGGQVLVGQLVDVTTVTAEHHTLVGLVTVAIISQDGLGGSLHGSQVLVGRSSNWGQVLVGGQLVHITTVATEHHTTVGLVTVAIISENGLGSSLNRHWGQVLVGRSGSLDRGQVLVGQLVHITTVTADNHTLVGLVTVAIIGQDGLGSLDGSQVLVGRSNGLLDGGQVLVGQLVHITTVATEHHATVGLVAVAIIGQLMGGGSLHLLDDGGQVLVAGAGDDLLLLDGGQVLVGGQVADIGSHSCDHGEGDQEEFLQKAEGKIVSGLSPSVATGSL